MTQEEFYVWLINNKFANVNLPEFDPEFLKKYEISKLILDKFCIHALSEEKQRSLNFEAVSAWFRVSEYIRLKYDIPEILELLPEKIVGNLSLGHSEVQSLPKLEAVGGNLNLHNSKIQSLPKLESVRRGLDLYNSKIESLPQLEYVGERLDLRWSKIQSLPRLEYVKYDIVAGRHKMDYWRSYFTKSERPDLAEKVQR